MKSLITIALVLITQLTFAQQAPVSIERMTVERAENPQEIDMQHPRLGWNLRSDLRGILQISYELRVASSSQALAAGKADLWNSGELKSPELLDHPYAGPALQSNRNYYWQVRVNTNKGASAWSSIAYWHTGLLQAGDWKAKWIGMDSAFAWDSVSKMARLSARYLRKEFELSKPLKAAHAFVAGLGLHELYVNGNKANSYVLAPSPTDYSQSVRYISYDLTKALKQGRNCLGTILGNGRFFTMRQNYKPQKWHTFGYPKLLVQLELEFTDGSHQTIITDGSWKLTADGPIRSNNEYDGEEYDARKEFGNWSAPGFNDKLWLPVQLVAAPGGVLTGHINPPMTVMRKNNAAWVRPSRGNKLIVDMAQNMAGWVQLRMHGRRGDTVRIRYAESLQADGSIYTANLRDALSTDVYIFDNSVPVVWAPRFVYHGFRYLEISGLRYAPERSEITGMAISDKMDESGSFTSSNATLDRIYQNAVWGVLSDYKGMPVDCPQRNERQPWLGDRATGCYGESFAFDNYQLYRKWMRDIRESQTAEGSIPDVAPSFWYYYKDNMTWPGTYLMVGDMLLKQFGDREVIREHYPAMKKWLLYMKSKYLKDGIMTKDSYGDWCVPPESPELIHSKDSSRITNPQLIATAYYCYMLQLLQKFAPIADVAADIVQWRDEYLKERAIFHKAFYQPAGFYGNNTVTANLLPIAFDLVPGNLTGTVFQSIVNRVEKHDQGHISTGLIGTQWLMRTLTEFGRSDLALKLATVKTYPGWGYMVEQGATTIWELWNGNTANPSMNSQNHVMLLGDLLVWMYQDLGGIQPGDESQPYYHTVIRPAFRSGLTSAKVAYQSVLGKIESSWSMDQRGTSWTVTIPAGVRASLQTPFSLERATENKRALNTSTDVYIGAPQQNLQVLELGSGHYEFFFPYSTR